VDPLDGTKEFIKRNGEFTVNIALMKNGKGVIGVVHAPVLGETFFGVDQIGSFVKSDKIGVEKISVKEYSDSDSGLVLVCSRSHLDDKTKEFMSKFSDPKTISMGSSLKFMLVARGDAHVYPRFAPTMEWDTAASQVVVEQAGGSVVNVETNQPLTYNKENLRNPFFICYANKSNN